MKKRKIAKIVDVSDSHSEPLVLHGQLIDILWGEQYGLGEIEVFIEAYLKIRLPFVKKHDDKATNMIFACLFRRRDI